MVRSLYFVHMTHEVTLARDVDVSRDMVVSSSSLSRAVCERLTVSTTIHQLAAISLVVLQRVHTATRKPRCTVLLQQCSSKMRWPGPIHDARRPLTRAQA